ncbi:hypothetical protein LCGC14_1739100, partial [marine sediment metagenome]
VIPVRKPKEGEFEIIEYEVKDEQNNI